MGYVGNQTTNAYTSLDKQTITGDGGTSYTLDHAVANEQEIEVFVNNVRQEPSVAYTVSGTALTMTGNVAASDSFYVVFQGKVVGTVVPPDLTVDTAKIKDSAVTTAKIADNAVDTAQIADDAVTSAKINDVTAKQATENTPMFKAYLHTNQSIAQNTWTIIQFANKAVDPLGEFNTSNYRYTPSVAGWYHVTLNVSFNGTGGTLRYTHIRKNGATVTYSEKHATTAHRSTVSAMAYLDGIDDYLDFRAYTQATANRNIRGDGNQGETQVHAFLVRAD